MNKTEIAIAFTAMDKLIKAKMFKELEEVIEVAVRESVTYNQEQTDKDEKTD